MMKTINNFLKIRNPETGAFEALPGVVSGSGESEGIAYSTNEVKTNDVWIDGKPIYTRTFVQKGVAVNVVAKIAISDIAFESIWVDSMNTFCVQNSTVYCSHHTASTHARISSISVDVNAKVVQVVSETATTDFYVTLRYTKTTD